MKVIEENPVMIFRKDWDNGTSYSIGLSKKDKNGNFVNGYMPCSFKKGVELENKTKIYIKDAWLNFNVKDNKTYTNIFINEYETVEETIKNATDPFEEFAEETMDLGLPF